jgi:glycine/D-amino acid oxidase-like deaminating enzyme
MSNKPPPIEYAATNKRAGNTAWRSLSRLTSLPIERIEELAGRDELGALFSPQTGRLRPAAEIRSLEAAGRLQARPPQPTPQQRLVELYRHPPAGPVKA